LFAQNVSFSYHFRQDGDFVTKANIGVCYRTPMDGVYGQGAREKLRELIVEIFDKSFVL